MQTESVKYWTLKRILGYVLILILMPVTLMVSWHFGDRKYYLCSLILIVYSIIPFLLSYENGYQHLWIEAQGNPRQESW